MGIQKVAGEDAASVSSAAPSSTPERFIVGDALRGIAATAVVLYHCAFGVARGKPFADSFPWPIGQLLTNLDLGVLVFFSLSGYLIARPFVRAYVLGGPPPAFWRYVRNRILRIAPLFWVVFTVALLRHLAADDHVAQIIRHDGPGRVLAIYLFGQNYWESTSALLVGPAWSLDVELVFYAVVPVVAYLLLRADWKPATARGRMLLAVAGCAGLAGVSLASRVLLPETIGWTRSFPAMVVGFAPGVAFAAIEPAFQRRRLSHTKRARTVFAACIVGCISAALLYHWAAPRRFGFEAANPPVRIVLASAVGGFAVLAPLSAQWMGRTTWNVLDGRSLRWLGARSYGVYLWHTLALAEVSNRFGGVESNTLRLVLLFGSCFALTLVLSTLSYRFVESPFLRLRSPHPGHPATDMLAARDWVMRTS